MNKLQKTLGILSLIIIGLIGCSDDEPTDVFGNIYGTIYDADTNSPILGASVALEPLGNPIVTGEDGKYKYNRLEAGNYKVKVSKIGYQTNQTFVTIEPGQTTQGDIHMYWGSGNLRVNETALDFGLTSDFVTLKITNTGQSAFDWNLMFDCDWITVASQTVGGKLSPNANESVVLQADRSKLPSNETVKKTTVIINAGDGGSVSIPVTINQEMSGGITPPIVVSNGLVAYYMFDGENMKDYSDSGINGRTVNQPDYITDTPNGEGKAISLVSSKKHHLVIPRNPLSSAENTKINEFSLSFWIKDFGSGMLFSLVGRTDNLSKPYLNISPDNILKMNMTSYNANFGQGIEDYRDGRWHLMTYTFNQGKHIVYIDGDEFSTITAGTYQSMSPDALHFGGDAGFSNYRTAMSLKLDNIRVYNRSLSRVEVRDIYNFEK